MPSQLPLMSVQSRLPDSLWRLSGAFRARFNRAAAWALLVMLQAFVAPADAGQLTAADEKNVRAVVQAQLQAFAKDDAVKAFSYAAPNIQQALGSASRFMAMVRQNYPVVYRPASVAFLKPEGSDDDVVQRVQMTDASGNSWLAVYSLQRQKSKSWRITACSVVDNRGRMT